MHKFCQISLLRNDQDFAPILPCNRNEDFSNSILPTTPPTMYFLSNRSNRGEIFSMFSIFLKFYALYQLKLATCLPRYYHARELNTITHSNFVGHSHRLANPRLPRYAGFDNLTLLNFVHSRLSKNSAKARHLAGYYPRLELKPSNNLNSPLLVFLKMNTFRRLRQIFLFSLRSSTGFKLVHRVRHLSPKMTLIPLSPKTRKILKVPNVQLMYMHVTWGAIKTF